MTNQYVHDLVITEYKSIPNGKGVLERRFDNDNNCYIQDKAKISDNAYLVMFMGFGELDHLPDTINQVTQWGFTPTLLWGWNRKIKGQPYPIIYKHGLLTTEYMILGVKGEGNAIPLFKRIDKNYGSTVFDANVEGWQLDIELRNKRLRPRKVYETIASRLGSQSPCTYGLANVQSLLGEPWVHYLIQDKPS